jgi:hypothetical protein
LNIYFFNVTKVVSFQFNCKNNPKILCMLFIYCWTCSCPECSWNTAQWTWSNNQSINLVLNIAEILLNGHEAIINQLISSWLIDWLLLHVHWAVFQLHSGQDWLTYYCFMSIEQYFSYIQDKIDWLIIASCPCWNTAQWTWSNNQSINLVLNVAEILLNGHEAIINQLISSWM